MNTTRIPSVAAPLIALLLAVAVGAQDLRLLLPTGASRGQHLKVACYGLFLEDTHAVVWLDHDKLGGIDVKKIDTSKKGRVTLHLHIHDDCALGRHTFQLQTKRGLTRAKAFRVSPLQSILERRSHGTRETAQRIGLNMTVDGRILSEEVDWYAVEVDQGQRVRAEVEAVRLGFYDFDVELEVFDPDGRMVARFDDSSLGKADPVAHWTAAKTGTYWLTLRDVAFRGSSAAAYRLHVGTFPRPIGLLPAGGRPGERIEVQLIGDSEPATSVVQLPDRVGLHEVFVTVAGLPCPTPVRIRVDNSAGYVEGATPKDAPKAPCSFHGIIAKPGEEDRYAFQAEKGKRTYIHVLARYLRSPLDPVLIIRDAKGKAVTSNDDGFGHDCRINFNPPATGTYFACVRDHQRRGDPAQFYRIEVGLGSLVANLSESVPGRLTEDFGVAVPRGARNATLIRAQGISAGDKATLTYESLPAGVRASTTAVPTNLFTPVVFSADAAANLTASLATPRAAVAEGRAQRLVRHLHQIPVLRVRNQETYDTQQITALPVAVTAPVPFDLKVEQPKVPIVRSGSLQLPITVTRAKKFVGTVTIQALALPAGVSASTVRCTKNSKSGTMTINANSRAAVGKWPIVLIASTPIGGVTRTISSEIFTLSVEQPWITAKVPRTKLERGTKGTFELELTRAKQFEGKVTATLGRVPKGVKYTVPEITAAAETLPIQLEIANNAPIGRHRYIYVQLKIQTKDGLITHNVGSGEIRVDRPLPAEATTQKKDQP